jgi:hypothetical protein
MNELKNIINECVDENNEKICEIANDLYKTYATNIVLNNILVDDNLGLDKDIIKKMCSDELLNTYSIANSNINDMIESAFNSNINSPLNQSSVFLTEKSTNLSLSSVSSNDKSTDDKSNDDKSNDDKLNDD